ncbi:ribonuclease T1 [Pedococcus dokdonensis]|uniref:Ribonuclease T1 n=1 Tax=Pedococcus dokdonensis TaxID=443156 RepID=A0A1H0M0X3_9MICO|nr:ribonuclease domain-containing protein [Pedococcus dokdonensis]SDO74045.1 ribonuclease T1 [Pedococcus dokdonensis]
MSADQRRIARLALAVVVGALVLVLWWWATDGSQDRTGGSDRGGAASTSAAAPGPTGSSSGSPTRPVPGSDSGLPLVRASDLPVQARRTLDLIAAGGPYPYSRDGVVFQNRERLLPRKASGYYHEYTVPTPGEDDRGARRIISGRVGELYWTADHYASFNVIVPSGSEGGAP